MRPERSISPRRYYVGAALLVLVGLVIGLGLSAGFNVQIEPKAAKTGLSSVTSSAPIPESPFVGVVDKALPAVVFIDVRKGAARGNSDGQGGDEGEEWFHRFFNDAPRRQQRIPSSGSGFIVDTDGHILTNNHVVSNAQDITVTLNDKRTFKAKVVGADPGTDVAVIKIEGTKLPVLPLGDSDKMRVGDWAIAIGNPLGQLRGSVTVGIISATGRSNLNIFGGTPDFQDFIQTDASINFGNSGGPLCNIRGEAIGINTAINPSGQGIGFAIPMNLARHVADQLVAHGEVQRAWLGVNLAELTPEIAEGFGIKEDRGVVISNVISGQPADKAGLRRNDVIVEYDGQPVADLQKFRLKVADTPVGRRVPVTVLRDGKRVNVAVTLGLRDQAVVASLNEAPRSGGAPGSARSSEQLGGLTVRDLDNQERSEAGVRSGVLVTEVKEGSPADDAGLAANDVIEEVGGKPATDSGTFGRMLRDAKSRGKHAVLLVRRGNNSQFVPLRLSE
ncbi:MAG TPA: Do family serine endopeptidase [Candidatus Eisenbacteria bacterium]|nr:Do family serine endopeptidase [Candidatus Eisenbacteria bacterium]